MRRKRIPFSGSALCAKYGSDLRRLKVYEVAGKESEYIIRLLKNEEEMF